MIAADENLDATTTAELLSLVRNRIISLSRDYRGPSREFSLIVKLAILTVEEARRLVDKLAVLTPGRNADRATALNRLRAELEELQTLEQKR